ncbi:hypothetical protein SDC9_186845 [bioreactor metagenome]|uniref:Uncharacterized protein n=1 Tax=bioreactor metagenome TaxID=1076179 RepID=A0A645HK07_9ZZZZ
MRGSELLDRDHVDTLFATLEAPHGTSCLAIPHLAVQKGRGFVAPPVPVPDDREA